MVFGPFFIVGCGRLCDHGGSYEFARACDTRRHPARISSWHFLNEQHGVRLVRYIELFVLDILALGSWQSVLNASARERGAFLDRARASHLKDGVDNTRNTRRVVHFGTRTCRTAGHLPGTRRDWFRQTTQAALYGIPNKFPANLVD